MIVVTGGTGFLGGHLLLKLIEQNSSVKALFRKGSDPKKVFSVWKHYTAEVDQLFNKIEWVEFDLLNKSSLFDALSGASHIYHCAARVSFDSRYNKEMWHANVVLTEWIVDFCLLNKVEKLAYVSSVAAVGKAENGLPAEEKNGWPTHPKTMYSKTKTLAEFEVWRGIAEGLNAVIVNPSVILGPGNWTASSTRIYRAISDGMKYFTGGSTGFVDVMDVVQLLNKLMLSDISGERFILNAANLSYYEAFGKIAHALSKPPPMKKISPILTSVLWRFEWLNSRLSKKEARITRSTARSAHANQAYSSGKIQNLGYSFTDIDHTILNTAQKYLADNNTE